MCMGADFCTMPMANTAICRAVVPDRRPFTQGCAKRPGDAHLVKLHKGHLRQLAPLWLRCIPSAAQHLAGYVPCLRGATAHVARNCQHACRKHGAALSFSPRVLQRQAHAPRLPQILLWLDPPPPSVSNPRLLGPWSQCASGPAQVQYSRVGHGTAKVRIRLASVFLAALPNPPVLRSALLAVADRCPWAWSPAAGSRTYITVQPNC